MLHNVTHCEHILQPIPDLVSCIGDCFIYAWYYVFNLFSRLGASCILFQKLAWFLRTASYINDKMVLCYYNCCYSVVREKYFIKHSSEEIHAIGWYSLVATRCPSLPHKVVNISPCQENKLTIHTILSPKGETLQSTTCKHLREKEGSHVARVPLLLRTSANVSTEGC